MKTGAESASPLRNKGGFSLVEALVAIAILSIVMLGTASMLFTGLAGSAGSNNRYLAVSTAQSWIETLMNTPFANLTSQLTPVTTTANGVSYRTKWRVSSVTANLAFINMSTTWTDKNGDHGMNFSAVRSR
uniref:Prepilin-type N-terminal cleavage/methylation domain-containing protein n=1 Tax=Geobacter metallireducens TaxID=28232 RepID=A0A831U3J8_GEOME